MMIILIGVKWYLIVILICISLIISKFELKIALYWVRLIQLSMSREQKKFCQTYLGSMIVGISSLFLFSVFYEFTLMSSCCFLITTKYFTQKPSKNPVIFPSLSFQADCAFLLINVKITNDNCVQSVNWDKNFAKLPGCETSRYVFLTKRPWVEKGQASGLNNFMTCVFKSILLECSIKSKEQIKLFFRKWGRNTIRSLCLLALASILAAQISEHKWK